MATVSFGSVSALKPEWWALEGLIVLEENIVVTNLVNRDYDNFFVNAGDTVNVSKADSFTAATKTKGSTVTAPYTRATGQIVKLNH